LESNSSLSRNDDRDCLEQIPRSDQMIILTVIKHRNIQLLAVHLGVSAHHNSMMTSKVLTHNKRVGIAVYENV